MADLLSLSDTIAFYGLSARKSLGQHFLLDDHWLQKIVRHAGDLKDRHVIEIGPGPGGLTRALLASNALSVTAIEMDERCIAALLPLGEMYGSRFHLIGGDALKYDMRDIPAPRAIVANLPYNVGTELLVQWLHDLAKDMQTFSHITVLLQKEVAQRVVAAPGSKTYGRLSVISQFLCECHIAFDIPPGAFVPPPKVVSSLLYMKPRSAPLAPVALSSLERVTQAAFGQRRKMLRAALKSLGMPVEPLMEAAQIEPTERAENIDVMGFCRLAAAWESQTRYPAT